MRKRRLIFNMLSSLFYQVATVICGFILPRLILETYGSGVNGLVNSVSQFLHIISFLELGVGAVVQSALYKPLADKNNSKISEILKSATKFFRNIGIVLSIYVAILIVIYPVFLNREYDFLFSATLILSISISSFAQYYFGVVDGLLLNADQRGFIVSISSVFTVILTTVICCVEMCYGASIQLVKLSASIIYLLRPIIMRVYVRTHYSIDRKISYIGEPIKQKWNGIAQHISTVVLDQTDIIVLTIFSNLANVSIYSVYQNVVFGIKNLYFSVANGGIQSLIGELWARNEKEKINTVFTSMEWAIHTTSTFIYVCTAVLIVPFVLVYTDGITDAEYSQPLFAALLVIANATHCLRLPYHIMIKATGKYKETQCNYIISTAINLILSIILVNAFGLVGVTIGTVVAMLYQTVWMAVYTYKNLLNIPIVCFIKQSFVDLVTFLVCVFLTQWFVIGSYNYPSWIILSIKVVVVCSVVFIIFNFVLYRDRIKTVIALLKNR